MSSLGQNIHNLMPYGMHLIVDAGYTLSEHLIIPYSINDDMPRSESKFYNLHSRTRITVEPAFGLSKGRWRILKRALNMKTPASIGRTIVACMVLHNWMIDVKENAYIPNNEVNDLFQSHNWKLSSGSTNRACALAKRDRIKRFLMIVHDYESEED